MNTACVVVGILWALALALTCTLAGAQWLHRRKATDAEVFHGPHHGER